MYVRYCCYFTIFTIDIFIETSLLRLFLITYIIDLFNWHQLLLHPYMNVLNNSLLILIRIPPHLNYTRRIVLTVTYFTPTSLLRTRIH